jgi:DNA-binding MarR family transcriptional regulator
MLIHYNSLTKYSLKNYSMLEVLTMNAVQEPLSDQVFHRFLALQHYLRRHARQLIDERGLTPRDLAVLRYLLESESATVGQVQAYMHKSPSTTSSLLAQLEEKGYVTRTRSPKDNRVVIVELTFSGQEIAENTPLGGLPLLRRRLGTMSEQRLSEINEVLNEIIQLMEVTDIE